MKIYKGQNINELNVLYGRLLYPSEGDTMSMYLQKIADKLFQATQSEVSVAYLELTNYNPDFIGQKREDISLKEVTLTDARHTIACEYGFENWDKVAANNEKLDIGFENVVNALLAGRVGELQQMLEDRPGLISQRSQFGHKATLLHYTGSNGVEFWRQVVPMNLKEVIECLLGNGADKSAKMNVYGGQFDTLSLLTSSCHPYEAGVGKEAEEVLKPDKF